MLRTALILLLLMNNVARSQMLVGLDKDSLRRVLVTPPSDTAKVATLILLARQLGGTRPDSAIIYYQEAARLSRQLNLGPPYRLLGEAGTNDAARRHYGLVIVLVLGALLLAALAIGILFYYRQRRQLQLKADEALQLRRENTRLIAVLEGQVNEQQRVSREMREDLGSELMSLLALSRAPGDRASTLKIDPATTLKIDPATIPKIEPASTLKIDPATTLKIDPASTLKIDPDTLLKMQQKAEHLIRKTNEIAWMLDHEENSLGSLIVNIRSNATHLLEQAGIDLHFTIDNEVPAMAVTQEFRRDVYLIVKEAVNNTIRHSGASVVEISIHLDVGEMTIVVRDNGKGIYKAGGSHWGNGMKDMQRRVEQIDGRMEITAGAGTAITIVSPLPYL